MSLESSELHDDNEVTPLSVDDLHSALPEVDRGSVEETVTAFAATGRLEAPNSRKELMDGMLTTIGYIQRLTLCGRFAADTECGDWR